jgi:hypothetical protein
MAATLWARVGRSRDRAKDTTRRRPAHRAAGLYRTIEHMFTAEGGVWQTFWQLSPADLQSYWVLDTSHLETDTVMSY